MCSHHVAKLSVSTYIKWVLTEVHKDIQLKDSNSQTINTRGPSGKVAITHV